MTTIFGQGSKEGTNVARTEVNKGSKEREEDKQRNKGSKQREARDGISISRRTLTLRLGTFLGKSSSVQVSSVLLAPWTHHWSGG